MLESDHENRQENETLFVFPFDHENRNALDAYEDISEKLRSLDYPLLFLSHLKNISFNISGTLGLYGKKIEEQHRFDDISADFIRLTQNDGGNKDAVYDNSLWMFNRTTGGHTYSVGFFVDANGGLIPKTHTAFCFFPTKEATGLNFIIHAPFLLTDSREGIRAGIAHNQDMVQLLSELAASSLTCLKKIGFMKKQHLIDDNIFNILPYDENAFSDIGSKKTISFKPFFTAIRAAFQDNALVPSNTPVMTGL